MRTALARAIRDAAPEALDLAAVELARHYAALIDEGEPAVILKAGTRLLDVLVELKLTPKARAAVVGGGTNAGNASALDELRARRERRAPPQHAAAE